MRSLIGPATKLYESWSCTLKDTRRIIFNEDSRMDVSEKFGGDGKDKFYEWREVYPDGSTTRFAYWKRNTLILFPPFTMEYQKIKTDP